MTVQVAIPAYGKSKATLQAILNTNPTDCKLYDPSIFPGSRGHFNASAIQVGESFPVVMDPERRTRFALIKRTAKGFKVS